MLKWISERLDGVAEAHDTAIGRVPTPAALDTSGLAISDEALDTLLGVDLDVWDEEASLVTPHYEKFGARLPQRLWDEHEALLARLKDARGGKVKIAAERGPASPRVAAN